MPRKPALSYEERVRSKFSDEEEQNIVTQWLQSKAYSSKLVYLIALSNFCKHAKKKPSQLIDDREAEIKRHEEESFMDFAQRMKGSERLFQRVFAEIESEGKLAPRTILTQMLIVKSFFSYWKHPLSREDTQYRKGKRRKFHDKVLSESDYEAIVNAGDIKEKLRVVWLAMTGMRLGDAHALMVKDLTEFDLEKMEAVKNPMCISYLPEKTEGRGVGERYTFLGEYGIELLKADLRTRIEEHGIEAVRKQYLFLGYSNAKLSNNRWNEMIKSLSKKAGLKFNGDGERVRPHTFRKFFDSQLQGKGMNKNFVYWMMGHALEGMEASYFQGHGQKENLRKSYQDKEKYLTPLKTKVVEKVIKELPTEFIEQMTRMAKTITSLEEELDKQKVNRLELREELNKQKQNHLELKKDFESLVLAVTKRGTEEIFKDSEGIPESELHKFSIANRRK